PLRWCAICFCFLPLRSPPERHRSSNVTKWRPRRQWRRRGPIGNSEISRAAARRLPAARTPLGVPSESPVELDALQRPTADGPRQEARKLARTGGGLTAANRLGDLAELLHQPPERTVQSAGPVARAEGRTDLSLQRRYVHSPLRGATDSGPWRPIPDS